MNDIVPVYPGSRVGHVVDAATGCWNWVGAVSTNGYGRIGIPGSRKTAQVHRVYYERAKGKVPDGLDLDHLCRRRHCVNPDHLEPVTRAVNARRGAKTKLTAEQVGEIRRRYAAGGVTTRMLGSEYGVDNGHVSDILNYRTWRVA